MREDVHYFAEQMSRMMDIKDQEKGPIDYSTYTLQKALMHMQGQWKRLEEQPTPSGEEMSRILIHIANFAMIAEGLIGGGVGRLGRPGVTRIISDDSHKFFRRCQARNVNGTQCGEQAGHEGKHMLGDSVTPW
jgi:hypothetical protein